MRMKNTGRWMGIAIALMLSSTVGAYEAITVSNGGSISGKISFAGARPVNPSLDITKDVEFCGGNITADYYVISADGGLMNAVISIENIKKGKSYDKKALIKFENKKCVFEPHVSVAVKGQKLGIVSRDPVFHNTHLYHGKKQRTLYNIAIPLMDKVIKKKLKKSGDVVVKCDAHEWMLAYVYVADHPYSTVSAKDGSFTIKDVPPGDYKIKIWHEKLGVTSQNVTVTASSTATLNYSFSQ